MRIPSSPRALRQAPQHYLYILALSTICYFVPFVAICVIVGMANLIVTLLAVKILHILGVAPSSQYDLEREENPSWQKSSAEM